MLISLPPSSSLGLRLKFENVQWLSVTSSAKFLRSDRLVVTLPYLLPPELMHKATLRLVGGHGFTRIINSCSKTLPRINYFSTHGDNFESVDIAIVGGGPAGLALACALCTQSITTRIDLDTDADITHAFFLKHLRNMLVSR